MGRLIDTGEFEKRIKPYDTEDDMDKALYNFAHYHLVTTPSAQPEIIRCKDCIHRKKDEIFGDRWCHGRNINDDWFCADAERREV